MDSRHVAHRVSTNSTPQRCQIAAKHHSKMQEAQRIPEQLSVDWASMLSESVIHENCPSSMIRRGRVTTFAESETSAQSKQVFRSRVAWNSQEATTSGMRQNSLAGSVSPSHRFGVLSNWPEIVGQDLGANALRVIEARRFAS